MGLGNTLVGCYDVVSLHVFHVTHSDGLKLARLVDPDGIRTIGVLTKVDIMDQVILSLYLIGTIVP